MVAMVEINIDKQVSSDEQVRNRFSILHLHNQETPIFSWREWVSRTPDNEYFRYLNSTSSYKVSYTMSVII